MVRHIPFRRRGRLRGLSVNALIPNALTVLGLCLGLAAIRFALLERWELAVASIIAAGIIDGLDGRVARILKASTEFGAQLDSLSDFLSFGVAPAVVLYLWTLQEGRALGWAIALLFAVCMALRLARFNASLVKPDRPAWAGKFFSGVPAPSAGGIVLLPMMLSFEFGETFFREAVVVALYTIAVSLLTISTIPMFSGKGIRVRNRHVVPVLLLVGLLFAAVVGYPWYVFSLLGIGYLASIPFSRRSYRRYKAAATEPAPDAAIPQDDEPNSDGDSGETWGDSRSDADVGRETVDVAVEVAGEGVVEGGVERLPPRRRQLLEHRAERHFQIELPETAARGRSRREPDRAFFDVAETGLFEGPGDAAVGAEAEGREIADEGRCVDEAGGDRLYHVEDRVVLDRPPHQEGGAAAGLEDTPGFGQGGVGAGTEHQAEAADDAIERAVAEGQVFHVGDLEAQVGEARRRCPAFRAGQHFRHQVGRRDGAGIADAAGDRQRRLADPRGEVEHGLAGREIGRVEQRRVQPLGELADVVGPAVPGVALLHPEFADGGLEVAGVAGVAGGSVLVGMHGARLYSKNHLPLDSIINER